jgi:hypothetical protein
MADYQLTSTDMIIRTADGASIPPAEGNRDYAEYLKWVEGGGVADPYVEPEKEAPQPTPQQELAFDHENRIRVLEGQPPLSMADLIAKMAPK